MTASPIAEASSLDDRALSRLVLARAAGSGVVIVAAAIALRLGTGASSEVDRPMAPAAREGVAPAAALGIAAERFALVLEGDAMAVQARHVFPGALLDTIGLKPGDLVQSVDGHALSSEAGVLAAAARLDEGAAGAPLTLGIVRAGRGGVVTVALDPSQRQRLGHLLLASARPLRLSQENETR